MAALHCPSVAGAQEALPSFRDVDFLYAQHPEVFQDLWRKAQSQTIRIAVLGDSQETSPTSHGFQYIPLLNYEMWKRFGNAPETPVVGCFDYGTAPPANWLLAGRCGMPGATATRLSSSQILPNAKPAAFSTLNSTTNVTGGTRGQLTLLQHDASTVHASAGIPTNVAYFDPSGEVRARIYAATNASSGEVAYQARPNATATPTFSAAVTSRGTLTLGLQSSTFAIKSGETAPLEFNGNHYLQLEVFGSSDSALTDIVGMRFVNKTHPEGVVVDTFSLGGYTAASFLSAHANAGPMFAALGFHAAILHYGANEGASLTAAQFKSNIAAVISRVRTWVGSPSFPVILIADVYQSRLTPEQMAEYDRYVGAELAIAQSDPNVMVINARRLMEDIGWNASNSQATQYLVDGVHYTALGAQSLAAAAVSAMMGVVHVSGCMSDPGTVTLESDVTLRFDLGGTSACTTHGQLSVAQALKLNEPTLEVVTTNDFTPAVENQFKVLSFASVSGAFRDITLPPLPEGLSWDTSALYTSGALRVVTTPPPPPPPTPDPPTITLTSGASQSVTLPQTPSAIGFTLTGSGPLTISASSSNATLLPNTGISISAGCGTQTLNCTATLAPANGQTGSSTVSLIVTDEHEQTAIANATLEMKPAAPPPSTRGDSEPGTGNGTSPTPAGTHERRGGGSFDVLSLLLLSLTIARARLLARRRASEQH